MLVREKGSKNAQVTGVDWDVGQSLVRAGTHEIVQGDDVPDDLESIEGVEPTVAARADGADVKEAEDAEAKPSRRKV